MKLIKKIFKFFKNIRLTDPLYSCEVYKENKCSHIDGYLCDMKTCIILKEKRGKTN